MTAWHAAWLPPAAWRAVGSRRVVVSGSETVAAEVAAACARFGGTVGAPADLVLSLDPSLGEDAYSLARAGGVTTVLGGTPAGLLYGLFEVVRRGAAAFGAERPAVTHRPAHRRRILDHWDNLDGQVERGYAGRSFFWPADPDRVRDYARLLAAIGINAVAVNNVNVHPAEARLLTDRIGEVAAIAGLLRPYGIRVHLAVSFAAPVSVGGLPTADPLDDGANLLAAALAPHGGVVHWRAFVYNHRQDWRDRSTDRARAAFDHFAPLDGRFAGNVIVQVKYGPIDFQTREPPSPVLLAMPATRLAMEVQVTQEYTGQQRHVCYLAPQWSELLAPAAPAELVAVSNAGDDFYWTGHPLAQANLYAFGRLAWDPGLDPSDVLDEWIGLTFGPADPALRRALHRIMDDSWRVYERYTAPLGIGFMVRPGHHYGPDVDGYEYTSWGTYHFADRDGVGVDRTRATGTGFTGQYPPPWAELYESVATCPDELLLFFHHVPYDHVLNSGSTVVQHIYDTHFAGAAQAAEMAEVWRGVPIGGPITADLHARVTERLAEQVRSAGEWRDQINAYFFRKSGIPDERGRRLDS